MHISVTVAWFQLDAFIINSLLFILYRTDEPENEYRRTTKQNCIL